MLSVPRGGGILSDFRELRYCGPCGPCSKEGILWIKHEKASNGVAFSPEKILSQKICGIVETDCGRGKDHRSGGPGV